MERRDAAATAIQPNERLSSSQLLVNRETRRPLFASSGPRNLDNARSELAGVAAGGRKAVEAESAGVGAARRARSDPQSTLQGLRKGQPVDHDVSAITPGSTRIPRLNGKALQMRRPISMAEAFQLAKEETEAAEQERQMGGSPSPAPRPWRSRQGQGLDENVSPGGTGNGGATPAGKTNSLQERIQEWRRKSQTNAEWAQRSPPSRRITSGDTGLPELVPGIEDVPFPSIESPERNFENASPNKTFTWQVDQDFTAGDLQISDSPRIKVGNTNKPFANRPSILDTIEIRSPARITSPGSRNTKLEEIRARELTSGSNTLAERQQHRRYTKLEEIRAREAAADKSISLPDRNGPRPKNTKLDEIRQRETEGVSRRALAAARLEEIKEQNAMSRPLSSDETKPQTSRDRPREPLVPARQENRSSARPNTNFEAGGERVPDTPVTIFKRFRDAKLGAPQLTSTLKTEDGHGYGNDAGRGKQQAGAGTDGVTVKDRELLRRLARAASASPAPEPDSKRRPASPRPLPSRSEKGALKPAVSTRHGDNGNRKSSFNSNSNSKNGDASKPTVGFAGLRRVNSEESTKSKRSSMHSESDPTARIEAEMKLFAPQDNYSERGSARASSPLPDSDEEEHAKNDTAIDLTPKPQKSDFLELPTPRVTGAYVETPVTIKVDKVKTEEQEDEKSANEHTVTVQAPAIFQDKMPKLAWRKKEQDTASEPGARDEAQTVNDSVTTSADKGKKPRAQSLPRRRPPMKNSAIVPSVKDDLRELQRQHNIDDSAMDDLEDILTGKKQASPKLERLLLELPRRPDEGNYDEDDEALAALDRQVTQQSADVKLENNDADQEDVSAGEKALYDKMSQTLRTGLLGIRDAKLGIQRLEDQVSNAEKKPADKVNELTAKAKTKSLTKSHKHHQHTEKKQQQDHADVCPECISGPPPVSVSYVHFPVPRLYHRRPQFRLTFLGLFLTMLSLWYATESAMCTRFCRPATCATTPCVYSYDDPTTFGSALPIKLDQWTTGGHGRNLFNVAVDELQDWMADVDDMMHGRSIEDVHVEQLSITQRRRHRRRLQKRGLLRSAVKTGPEQSAKWDAWHRTRIANERAREAGTYSGDNADRWWDDDTVGGDERVW